MFSIYHGHKSFIRSIIFLILMKFNLSVFFFYVVIISKNSFCLTTNCKVFFLRFFSISVIVLALTARSVSHLEFLVCVWCR